MIFTNEDAEIGALDSMFLDLTKEGIISLALLTFGIRGDL